MKENERMEARYLRETTVLSLKEIATILKVSQSSVSRWVRDIKLSPQQAQELRKKNPQYNNQLRGKNNNTEKFRKKRLEYQKSGRKMSMDNNALHLAGCMLYWAEGAKIKNSVRFSNTDTDMIVYFVNFLRKCYHVKNHELRIRISCYTDKGLSSLEIEKYWLSILKLSKSNLCKTLVNYDKRGGGVKSRRKKILYGVCEVAVNRTDIVQSIFGAIQEYASFKNERWVDAVYGQHQY